MLINTMTELDLTSSVENMSPNPTLHDSSTTTTNNNLDDIFGSDSEPDNDNPSSHNATNNHRDPTDIPRLRSIHVTAGYREGLSGAKESSVQAGFDEGFALGAEIGMASGWVLGVLRCVERRVGRGEGRASTRRDDGVRAPSLSSARVGVSVDASVPLGLSSTEETTSSPSEEASLISRLVEVAERELAMQSLFSGEYIEADGTWKYDHHDNGSTTDTAGEQDISFREVALAHPIIRKWTNVAQSLMHTLQAESQKGSSGATES